MYFRISWAVWKISHELYSGIERLQGHGGGLRAVANGVCIAEKTHLHLINIFYFFI